MEEPFPIRQQLLCVFLVVPKQEVFRYRYEPLALTFAAFKDQVATFEGEEKPRLADASSYKPVVDVIVKFPDFDGVCHGSIDATIDERRSAW